MTDKTKLGEVPEAIETAMGTLVSVSADAVRRKSTLTDVMLAKRTLRAAIASALSSARAEGRAEALEEAVNWLVCEAVAVERNAANLRKDGRYVLAEARDDRAEMFRRAADLVRSRSLPTPTPGDKP